MKQTSKRSHFPLLFLLLCIALSIFLFAGCKRKEAQPEATEAPLHMPPQATGGIPAQADEPAHGATGDTEDALSLPSNISGAAQSGAGEPGPPGSIEMLDSVAYQLQDMLYGAISFRNTGSEPLILREATFHFTQGGSTVSETFLPVSGEYDIVRPGEKSYCTLWLPYEGATAGEWRLAAELSAETTTQPQRVLMVESGYLVQNYPNHATLSGRISNNTGDTCNLIMVNAAFYDTQDSLIGVWFFTRNTVLQPAASTAFVTQMRRLPIPGIADSTAYIDFRAFFIL